MSKASRSRRKKEKTVLIAIQPETENDETAAMRQQSGMVDALRDSLSQDNDSPDDNAEANYDYDASEMTPGDTMFGDYAMQPKAGQLEPGRPATPKELDTKLTKLHQRLLGHFRRELNISFINRAEMLEDQKFYDNEQWSFEDSETLRNRGQVPLVYNVISPSIDWITGTEKRSRTEYKILARRSEDEPAAERKTQLMKYISDVNRTEFEKSKAFEDAIKVGIGWLEDGVDYDRESEPIYTRYVDWRAMLWDSAAVAGDLSDARYMFRSRWIDLDVALAAFPERAAILKQSRDIPLGAFYNENPPVGDLPMDEREAYNSYGDPIFFGDTEAPRQRIRMIEGWIKLPVKAFKMAGGEFNGEIYDDYSPAHREAVNNGESRLIQRVVMRLHMAVFTAAGMIWFSPSPYRHNRFPFTPIFAHRRGADGQPYGLIRRLKDIQSDINKRMSKAQFILSTNKVIMDTNALPDGMSMEQFMEEAARPDAVLFKKPGTEIALNVDRDLAPAHLDIMSRDISMIQQTSGVTDELLGRRTNAVSGIAIQSRQEQGSLATAKYFDNLILSMQVRGEKVLSLIEQFMSEQKQFRITNSQGKPEYVSINDGLPQNDIIHTKADFLVSETDWHMTLRQGYVQSLLEIMSRMPPQVGILLIDLVVENMDIPNRAEILNRIRQATGMPDPNADPNNPTPQEAAQMQAAAAQQQYAAMMQAIAAKTAAADADKKAAEAQRAAAEAENYFSQAAEKRAQMAGRNVRTQSEALQAAALAIQVPQATPAADTILHEGGFISQSEQNAQAMAAQQQMQQQAQQAQAMAAQQQQMQQQQAGLPQEQPPDVQGGGNPQPLGQNSGDNGLGITPPPGAPDTGQIPPQIAQQRKAQSGV